MECHFFLLFILAWCRKSDRLPKSFAICLHITNILKFQPVKARPDMAVLPAALQGLERAGDPDRRTAMASGMRHEELVLIC